MSFVGKLSIGLSCATVICLAFLFVTQSFVFAQLSLFLLGAMSFLGFGIFLAKSRKSLAGYGLREGVQTLHGKHVSDMVFGKEKQKPAGIDD